jgi:hypothetical protein
LTFHEFLADFLTFGPWPIQAINVVSASGRLVCDTERCVAASLGNTPHFQALGEECMDFPRDFPLVNR